MVLGFPEVALASTLSWSGSDGGDPAADAIFIAQPQSQREERVAWGGQRVEVAEADWCERECGVKAVAVAV
nr:hypothetical protein CFP56_35645 [Quercus suber]